MRLPLVNLLLPSRQSDVGASPNQNAGRRSGAVTPVPLVQKRNPTRHDAACADRNNTIERAPRRCGRLPEYATMVIVYCHPSAIEPRDGERATNSPLWHQLGSLTARPGVPLACDRCHSTDPRGDGRLQPDPPRMTLSCPRRATQRRHTHNRRPSACSQIVPGTGQTLLRDGATLRPKPADYRRVEIRAVSTNLRLR